MSALQLFYVLYASASASSSQACELHFFRVRVCATCSSSCTLNTGEHTTREILDSFRELNRSGDLETMAHKHLLTLCVLNAGEHTTRETLDSFRELYRSGDLDDRTVEMDLPSESPGKNKFNFDQGVIMIDNLMDKKPMGKRSTDRKKMKVGVVRGCALAWIGYALRVCFGLRVYALICACFVGLSSS